MKQKKVAILTAIVLLVLNFTLNSCKQCGNGKDNPAKISITNTDSDTPVDDPSISTPNPTYPDLSAADDPQYDGLQYDDPQYKYPLAKDPPPPPPF
jgi:hypothetical protein